MLVIVMVVIVGISHSNCGQIFCHDCSSKNAMLEKFGYTQPVRVCDACYEAVEASKRRAAQHIRSRSNVVRVLGHPHQTNHSYRVLLGSRW